MPRRPLRPGLNESSQTARRPFRQSSMIRTRWPSFKARLQGRPASGLRMETLPRIRSHSPSGPVSPDPRFRSASARHRTNSGASCTGVCARGHVLWTRATDLKWSARVGRREGAALRRPTRLCTCATRLGGPPRDRLVQPGRPAHSSQRDRPRARSVRQPSASRRASGQCSLAGMPRRCSGPP